MTRNPTNPYTDPAMGLELTMRERKALMTQDDWDEVFELTFDSPYWDFFLRASGEQ